MNRNRLLIIISSAVAILGAFLPWASVSAGFFGAMSIRGTQGDGTFHRGTRRYRDCPRLPAGQ